MGTFFSDISIQPLSQINKRNPIFFHDNRLFFGATIQILSEGLSGVLGLALYLVSNLPTPSHTLVGPNKGATWGLEVRD